MGRSNGGACSISLSFSFVFFVFFCQLFLKNPEATEPWNQRNHSFTIQLTHMFFVCARYARGSLVPWFRGSRVPAWAGATGTGAATPGFGEDVDDDSWNML
jgi:hypothetical protein